MLVDGGGVGVCISRRVIANRNRLRARKHAFSFWYFIFISVAKAGGSGARLEITLEKYSNLRDLYEGN